MRPSLARWRERAFLLLALWPAAMAWAGTAERAPAVQPPARGFQALRLPARPKVMVIPVNDDESTRYGMIDPWQASFIGRRLRAAKREKYDLVILEIDTHGGMIGACEKINRELSECGVPAVALIHGMAFSGGAIIAYGCDAIAMEPGSEIGGAQAVSLLGDLASDEREKVRSLLVAMMRGLSEKRGYPEALGRGMVDREVEVVETDDPAHRFMTGEDLEDWKKNAALRGPVPQVLRTVKAKDQILTLTSSEALNGGVAAAVVRDRDALFQAWGLAPAEVNVASVTATERVARFLGHPAWSVLLVLVALVALIWEMKSPGHGLGYLVFGFALGVFFWLALFADTAGTGELLLFGAGALLLALEFFVLPGFGVAGIVGLGLVLLSIALAFLPEGSLPGLWEGQRNPFQAELVESGLGWMTFTLTTICVGLVAGLLLGVRLPGFNRLALQTQVRPAGPELPEAPAATAAPLRVLAPAPQAGDALLGHAGIAETTLRPSGKVRLDGMTYEATADGAWVEAGRKVKVLEVRPTGLVVRELRPAEGGAPA